MPFLSDQTDWMAIGPPSTHLSPPELSDQNFEIAVLFSIVEEYSDYVLRVK